MKTDLLKIISENLLRNQDNKSYPQGAIDCLTFF